MKVANDPKRETVRLIPPWKRGAEGEAGGFAISKSKGAPILVVEDNVDDSFLLTRQLARADLDDRVTVIGDGLDAWNWLMASDAPLAMFVDLRLPRLSGIGLIKRIKAEPRLSDVPIIVMTGSLDPDDVETCTRLGVSAYLPKPVELSTFLKVAAHLCPELE